jgi:hypothetical protein
VVLIDRFGTNVVTWLDPASAKVRAQLAVGTGFEANAQDYLEISAASAVISRFGRNPAPGVQPFDLGGDLLLIDTQTPAIVGSLPLPEEDPTLTPSPGALTPIGEQIIVGLNRISADFARMGNARFVAVSKQTHQVSWMLELEGLQGCGKLVLSPSGKLAATACSGQYDATTFEYPPAASDVALFEVSDDKLRELRRLHLGQALGLALQPQLAFASDQRLLVTTFGTSSIPGDGLFAVDLETTTPTRLASAAKSYTFGGLMCLPDCSKLCLLADAATNVLRRYRIDESSSLSELDSISVESIIGLPPRAIGAIR